MTKKRAVVDVDSTLWDMDDILYAKLLPKYPELESPDKWDSWEFYHKYDISDDDFFKVVDEIHAFQFIYQPYKHAQLLTDLLGEEYHVVIASHRKLENKVSLKKWLDDYNFYYDEIFVGSERESEPRNKFHLFDGAGIVIDDSPIFCLEAAKRGADFICGLKHPWNEELHGTFLFAESMRELILRLSELDFIMREERV